MCFGSGEPRKYGINPEDDVPSTRRRRDVETRLKSVPAPYPRPSTVNRYPKQFRNQGNQFPTGVEYFEYPDEPYKYGEHQNAHGRQKIYQSNGRIETKGPGKVRAITDKNGKLVSTAYHPRERDGFLQRSDDIYGCGPFEQTYRYEPTGGARLRVR